MTDTDLFKLVLKENAPAVKFMIDLAHCSQVLDDLVDKDKDVSANTIQNVFWLLLIEIPNNRFYREYYDALWPVMSQVLNDWFVANEVESQYLNTFKVPLKRQTALDEPRLRMSYVLRDSMAQLLTHCALLLGGFAWMRQHAQLIRAHVHDESFDSYKDALK